VLTWGWKQGQSTECLSYLTMLSHCAKSVSSTRRNMNVDSLAVKNLGPWMPTLLGWGWDSISNNISLDMSCYCDRYCSSAASLQLPYINIPHKTTARVKSSSTANQFHWGITATSMPGFVQIHQQLLMISCKKTGRRTYIHTYTITHIYKHTIPLSLH